MRHKFFLVLSICMLLTGCADTEVELSSVSAVMPATKSVKAAQLPLQVQQTESLRYNGSVLDNMVDMGGVTNIPSILWRALCEGSDLRLNLTGVEGGEVVDISFGELRVLSMLAQIHSGRDVPERLISRVERNGGIDSAYCTDESVGRRVEVIGLRRATPVDFIDDIAVSNIGIEADVAFSESYESYYYLFAVYEGNSLPVFYTGLISLYVVDNEYVTGWPFNIIALPDDEFRFTSIYELASLSFVSYGTYELSTLFLSLPDSMASHLGYTIKEALGDDGTSLSFVYDIPEYGIVFHSHSGYPLKNYSVFANDFTTVSWPSVTEYWLGDMSASETDDAVAFTFLMVTDRASTDLDLEDTTSVTAFVEGLFGEGVSADVFVSYMIGDTKVFSRSSRSFSSDLCAVYEFPITVSDINYSVRIFKTYLSAEKVVYLSCVTMDALKEQAYENLAGVIPSIVLVRD